MRHRIITPHQGCWNFYFIQLFHVKPNAIKLCFQKTHNPLHRNAFVPTIFSKEQQQHVKKM